MLDYIKKLITPDMVSLWVPSGLNRAQDLIRGNHGQCYGTHPNVPVLPSLINPSVGWHFDMLDDYIEIVDDNSLDFGTGNFTIVLWVKVPLSGAATYEAIISKGYTTSAPAHGWGIVRYGSIINRLSYQDAIDAGGAWNASLVTDALSDGWHCICVKRAGNVYYLYADESEVDSETKTAVNLTNTSNLIIGAWSNLTKFVGTNIALPFIANKAWSIAQIENFYNATKGMFAPRG